MANLTKPLWMKDGWDSGRSLQVLPVHQSTEFYLVAGQNLDVWVEDEDLVALRIGESDDKAAHRDGGLSAWEKQQYIRRIRVAANGTTGRTTLHATQTGADFIEPLTLEIVADSNARQAGKLPAQVTDSLRKEIQMMPLRDAVIRVAEDQMHSAVCTASNAGFGVYDIDASLNWCGAFAYWCWAHACAIKGVPNPFGSNNTVLWSPQRAIHWAMDPSTAGQLLRYSGGDPMTGKGTQEYREIGWNGNDLDRADIVLLRKGSAGAWKHVCMVDWVEGDTVHTQDGNQGKGQSIKKVSRSMTAQNPDRSYELVFLHVLL